MLDSKFLRRIELYPSTDLAARRDLFEFQLTKPLDSIQWEALTDPKSAIDRVSFQSVHNSFVDSYKKHIKTHDPVRLFGIVCPQSCTNKMIYNLCLINRIRYELNYPLMQAEESEWINFLIYLYDSQFKLKLEFWLKEKLVND